MGRIPRCLKPRDCWYVRVGLKATVKRCVNASFSAGFCGRLGRLDAVRMPRYYCDYCDTYLTHDSAAVRKQHNSGYKHKANVRNYYMQFDDIHPSVATPPPAQQIPGGLPPHLLAARMAVAQAHGQLPMSFALPGVQPGQQMPLNLPRPPFPFPPGMMQPGHVPPYMMPPINPGTGAPMPGGPSASAPFGTVKPE